MSNEQRIILGKLREQEAVIEKHLGSFIFVGIAMKVIRDERLYKDYFETFEKYIKGRWGFEKSRAYQFIEAAEVTANLSTIVDKSAIPQNEAQLREVAKAPPEMQAEVVRKAVAQAAEENRKPTAKDYKKVVGELADESPHSEPSAPNLPKNKPISSAEQAKANCQLAKDYIAKAVNAVDAYHAVKPNHQRRAETIKLLQEAGKRLW